MEDDEDVFMDEDEENFDYDTTFPEKLPVAIEGPFTDSEILVCYIVVCSSAWNVP